MHILINNKPSIVPVDDHVWLMWMLHCILKRDVYLKIYNLLFIHANFFKVKYYSLKKNINHYMQNIRFQITQCVYQLIRLNVAAVNNTDLFCFNQELLPTLAHTNFLPHNHSIKIIRSIRN